MASLRAHAVPQQLITSGLGRQRYTPFFYRTQDGAEIDLVLERGDQPAVLEISVAELRRA